MLAPEDSLPFASRFQGDFVVLDTISGTRERAVGGRLGNPGANWIQIHINHAGRDGSFIKQRDSPKPTIPETPDNVIFSICTSSNRLGETAHEP